MKALILKVTNFLTFNDISPKTKRVLSAKSIRLLIWVRIVLKLYLWLLALYLIVNFAAFLRKIVM